MTLEKQAVKRIIPKRFIYEMDEGQPIYYKGTKAYLEGNTQNEEPIQDSNFQSRLKGKIYLFLSLLLMESPKHDCQNCKIKLSTSKPLSKNIKNIDNLRYTTRYY